ncbi:hypothetical protein QVD17_18750 [Tagetes erecta]|uniref:Homeobox domain-containing protein n=1 Tax=Tagetes erecta TaxID=13708 RepID=A0AAD8KNE6_TARER|nr:hypothetical protein QVD17_18750 [Tagetes erecta]
MEYDHSVCSTRLVLGLSLNSSSSSSTVKLNTTCSTNQPSTALDHKCVIPSFEPSLTLALLSNHSDHGFLHRDKSFSNMSLKRERDVGSDESERVLSGVTSVDDVEDDDDCVNGRKKLRLTKSQSALLEEAFKHHSSLNPKQKQELARELKLRPRQVEVWFQNRRARTKLKQTEMNFEHLKKCCEKLTDENQRLQTELQELKALKRSPPFYMQLPAATLTMCPSCERIGDAKPSVVKSTYNMAAKPHFFNPFTNPSAAC